MAESHKTLFRLPSGKTVPLNVTNLKQLSAHDTLMEVKAFLNETTELYLHQNYSFTYNHKPLNEYVEFSSLHIEDTIEIKLNLFQEASAKYHFKKVQDLLAKPEKITQLLGTFQKEDQKPKDKPEKPQVLLKTVLQGDLLTSQQFEPVKSSPPKLFEALSYSGFNPPPANRRLQEDFFYLSFKSQEGTEFQITAQPEGFSVNNSTRRSFDPSPHPSFPSHMSLFDLLQNLSQSFKNGFCLLLQEEPTDLFMQSSLVAQTYGNHWCEDQNKEHVWDESREFNELYGVDTSAFGDWNEDLQLCKALPREDFYQRANRDKTMVKIHNDFLRAAVEGAKAVIRGSIAPANPMDPKETQVFIYNQIFFSYAVDTPEHFKQDSGQDATFTFAAVNCDLRNLSLLHRMDLPNLFLQHAAIVDFQGHRVLAQSVVPGILNQEQNDQTAYGSIDEGKTIRTEESFKEVFSTIAKHFYLEDSVECADENGKVWNISGGLEVKGILGSDKRKYVLDTMRLSPRDVNYPGMDNNCCVLRLELIENYIMSQFIETASGKMMEYRKSQEALENNEKKEENNEKKEENNEKKEENKEKKEENNEKKEENKEKKEEQNELEQTKLELKQKEALEKQKEAYKLEQEKKRKDFTKFQELLVETQNADRYKFRFNSNLHTIIESCVQNCPESHQENLTKVANYLKQVAIPNLVKELSQDDTGRLADSKSLAEVFHSFGVNNRYLGAAAEQVDVSLFPNVKSMLEKAIFVRCLKHLLREKMRGAKATFLPHTVAHMFNCVFASQKQKIQLDSNKLPFDSQEGQKKKQKKQKVKKEAFVLIDTPKTVQERLQVLSNARYGYTLTNFTFDPLTALSILRDACRQTGIVLAKKRYVSVTQEIKSYNQLPYQTEDIINIQPVLKHVEVFNDDAKHHMDVAERLLQEERLQEAADMFQTSLQIVINLYGPVKKEVATCYGKLAQVFYKMAKVDQALLYQKLAVQTLTKLYGADHYATAHACLHLGLFFFGAQLFKKAEKYLLKALYYKALVGGQSNPDLQIVLMNVAMVYQQSKQHQAAIDCLLESQELVKKVFGSQSLRSAGLYQAVAMAHFEIQDYKKAVDYQKMACDIFGQLKAEDPRSIESQFYLKNLVRVMEEKMRAQDKGESGQSQRAFGSNKIKKQQPKVSDQEQEQAQQEHEKVKTFIQNQALLQEKLRLAKLNVKQARNQRQFKLFN